MNEQADLVSPPRAKTFRTAVPRVMLCATILFMAYGCATSAPPPVVQTEVLEGVASWYGEEFAGRTTANGEIFDPTQLTAAHRTLPFGTVVDVTNAKTNETVRVRINDRGPYVGNRVIDLSYAAAQKISLIRPGSGDVQLTVVKVGRGDREPPVPFEVTVAQMPAVAAGPGASKVAATDPPPVEFPLPSTVATPAPAAAEIAQPEPTTAETPEPSVVAESIPAAVPVVPTTTATESRNASPETVTGSDIAVIVERPGSAPAYTRRQVGADGRSVDIVEVPDDGSAPIPVGTAVPAPTARTPAESLDRQRLNQPASATPARRVKRGFFVQVGAFSVEANARALKERVDRIGQRSTLEHDDLYRVRIGPFATREQAVASRTALESNGISAIIVSE